MSAPLPLADRLKRCLAAHPDWAVERIAASIVGSTRAMVRAMQAGESIAPIIEEAKKAEAVPPSVALCAGVISLDAIRSRYDISAAIRRELAKLKPGALITENEMRQRAAGKDASRFRRTWENNEEFRANRIKLKLNPDDGEGTWYWADGPTVALALKLRDEI
jgi:hypothetical protein